MLAYQHAFASRLLVARMRFVLFRLKRKERARMRLRSYLCKAIRISRWQRMQSICIAYKYAERDAERGAKRALPDTSRAIVSAVDEEWLPQQAGAPKRRARRV